MPRGVSFRRDACLEVYGVRDYCTAEHLQLKLKLVYHELAFRMRLSKYRACSIDSFLVQEFRISVDARNAVDVVAEIVCD